MNTPKLSLMCRIHTLHSCCISIVRTEQTLFAAYTGLQRHYL